MEYWSLKTPQQEKTEGPIVAPVNVTNNFIILYTATKKTTTEQDMNVWLYYKMEKVFFLGSTTLLGVKCSAQTVAGSLEVGSEDNLDRSL